MGCEALGHIEAGAEKVIISAPGKGSLKTLAPSRQVGYFMVILALSVVG